MNYLKKIGISILYSIVFLILMTFLTTVFNYFNIINYKVVNVLKIIILITSFFIGGFLMGKKSLKKGWLEGLKFSIILLIMIFLINLILFDNSFKLNDLIYYLIIVLSSIFGSVIGINKNLTN